MATSKSIIAVDVMGGDFGPSVTLPACKLALQEQPDLHLLLVGDQFYIPKELKNHPRTEILHTTTVVAMDEAPATAMRGKKDSSMRLAIDQVKEGKAQAVVSAGNTGALMAISRFVLKMIPGVERPAIIYSMPAGSADNPSNVLVLDLGANVDCDADNLFQFAVIGSVLAKTQGIDNPRIGLLNIGSEAIKGSDTIKRAAELLSSNKHTLNYIGYVEGDSMYSGEVDVVVCDGFVGNVALKASEGIASMMLDTMRTEFDRNIWRKFIAFLSRGVFKVLKARLDPDLHNGALFLGLNGVAVKSHGGASINGFKMAILRAMVAARSNIPERIRQQVEQALT